MNAQTKHTPGPWMWNPEGDETVVRIPMSTGEQDFSVLGVSEIATIEDYANARLIAAAPELLDALKAYMSDYRSESCVLPSCGLCARSRAAEEKARAAIVKAVTP